MIKKKKVPKLRFPGFTDDWEQRKVSEVTTSYSGGTPQAGNSEYYNGTIPFIRSGEIYEKHTELFITQKGLENSSAKMVSKGDILYALYGATSGEVSRSNINGAINQAILAITPNDGCNANFLVEWFRKEKESIIDKYLQGGQGNLSAQIIKKLEIPFPTFEEQNKIGRYFTELNRLITLHQRKLEHTKDLKKSMLQKMFPKKGEKNPEIRFPGFTDTWEQRKLLDCAGFRRGSFPQPYGNKEWYDGEGAMPFVQVADITDDMKLVNDTKQKISKTAQPMSVFAEEGSVLVTLQGSIGRVAITQYGAFVDRTVLIFDKYNQDIDKTFWAYIIKEKFIDEARKAPGGTVKTITKEALSDFDLMIPSYGEQKNLGTFLVSIDRLITLHQRELEHLKLLKKGLLQQMFV